MSWHYLWQSRQSLHNSISNRHSAESTNKRVRISLGNRSARTAEVYSQHDKFAVSLLDLCRVGVCLQPEGLPRAAVASLSSVTANRQITPQDNGQRLLGGCSEHGLRTAFTMSTSLCRVTSQTTSLARPRQGRKSCLQTYRAKVKGSPAENYNPLLGAYKVRPGSSAEAAQHLTSCANCSRRSGIASTPTWRLSLKAVHRSYRTTYAREHSTRGQKLTWVRVVALVRSPPLERRPGKALFCRVAPWRELLGVAVVSATTIGALARR